MKQPALNGTFVELGKHCQWWVQYACPRIWSKDCSSCLTVLISEIISNLVPFFAILPQKSRILHPYNFHNLHAFRKVTPSAIPRRFGNETMIHKSLKFLQDIRPIDVR